MAAAIKCSQATTSEGVIRSIADVSAALGFEYYSVFEAIEQHNRVSLWPLLGRTFDEWVAHYRNDSLADSDLRLRRAHMSSRDFFCSEVLRDDPVVTDEERDFFIKARTFGIGDSYVLPYRTAGGRVFACVLLGKGQAITPELRVWVRTLAHEFLLGALRVKATQSVESTAPIHLTPREIQCLTFIRDGKSSNEIASLLNISVRTVDHYVGDACSRLGVRSRAQAVAKAIAQELIPPHPLA